jgi:Uma2 family endonuclease
MDLEVLPGEPVAPLPVEVYDRMVETGLLTDADRVELLDGVLVAVTPQGDAHDEAVQTLIAWAFDHVDRSRWRIRAQAPLRLPPSSEPEPDLTICRAGKRGKPTSARLVVEVASSSRRKDLELKRRIYAAGSVVEYWVVLVDEGQVVVHRDPAGGDFRDVVVCAAARFEGAELRVPDLLIAP